MPWVTIERLSHTHHRQLFDCGDEWMNCWVRERALKDDRAGRTAVHVALNSVGAVVAVYALNHGSIEVAGGRQELRAVQLQRLAVHRAHQGRGHGTRLLLDASRAALVVASVLPAKHFVVEASDEYRASWYEAHGFVRCVGSSLWLSMSISSLRSTIAALDTGTATVDAFERSRAFVHSDVRTR